MLTPAARATSAWVGEAGRWSGVISWFFGGGGWYGQPSGERGWGRCVERTCVDRASTKHSMRIEFEVRPGSVAVGGVEADGRLQMRAHENKDHA